MSNESPAKEKFIPFSAVLAKVSSVLRKLIFPTLASLALVSCENRSDVEIANEENILIVGNSNEPKGLDPHLVSGVLESNLIRSLFEGLCTQHPSKNGESLPGAAERWEHSDDFTEWTFHLNPDAKWSDGVPVTAHDFVFSYKRLLSPDPSWPAKYSEMLYFLENGEAYHRSHFGKILCGNDPDFPLEWDKLREANFGGDKKIKLGEFAGKDFEKLSTEERGIVYNSNGLDKLSKEQLITLKDEIDLLKWTDAVPAEIRRLVLNRLIAHHEAGKPNLWEKAKVGVTAVDDFTLKVDLRGPVPFLPEITKHYTWFPVPEHVVLKFGKINTAFESRWTRPGNLVSNGPFKLKVWRTNHYIEVERNTNYWDNETVSLDGIRFLPINNYYTETRMFGDDQIHVTYTVPSELIPDAKKKYPDQLRQEPYVGTRFVRVNTKRKNLNDPNLRKALVMALDRKSICEKILQGGQTPATGVVPPFGDYTASDVVRYDPEEAKALLAQANYDPSSTITLLTTNSDSGLREAESLQAMWEANLGIKVRIVQREWTTYLQRQYEYDYDLCVAGWIGDYLDPTTFLEMWITGGGNNNTGWGSQEFEDLLAKSENTADATERLKILKQAEDVFLNDTPILPIYYYTTNYLIRPEVKNWNALLLNHQPHKFISLEPDPR